MVIIIERELGTYNEADLIKEQAAARFQERKRILRKVNSLISMMPNQYSTRRKHLIAKEILSKFYQELKENLEIV